MRRTNCPFGLGHTRKDLTPFRRVNSFTPLSKISVKSPAALVRFDHVASRHRKRESLALDVMLSVAA